MTFKEIVKSIDKKEKLFILYFSIFLILLLLIPYLYGYFSAPENTYYNPIYGFSSGDKSVYYSYIEQIKQGNFLLKDLYTSEIQSRQTLNVLWLSLGILAKTFHLSPPLAFLLSQILLTPILIYSLYLLISLIFSSKIKRKIALIFISLASGLGFIINIFTHSFPPNNFMLYPLDLWVAEAFTFPSIFNSAHFIMSTTLIILIFLFSFLALEKNKIKYSIFSGICGLILFNFHPYHLATIIAVLSIYSFLHALKNKTSLFYYLKHLSIILIISAPSILYHVWLMLNDPITLGKAMQNICLTPVAWATIIAYGFLLIGAIAYTIILLDKKRPLKNLELFLITWFIVQFLLIYFPLSIQRRLTQGLNIPMALLCLLLIFYIFKKFPKLKIKTRLDKIILIFLFILLFNMSNVWGLINSSLEQKTEAWKFLYYINKEEKQAIDWLKNNLQEQDNILSTYIQASIIPGITGKSVFIGHSHETINSERKYKQMQWFFTDENNDELHLQFLKQNNITYIFYGPREKKLGAWAPQNKKYLEKVFSNEKIEIYKVL